MTLQPLWDRVLVKRIEEPAEEKTKGGIIIPDMAKEKPQFATVVAVGNGREGEDGTRYPLEVEVGQTVLFGKYSGSEIKLNGKPHLIIREDDVLAIVVAP